MDDYKNYDMTHRCHRLLTTNCSIRHFSKIKRWRIDTEGWYLFKLDQDLEYDWKGLSKVAQIEYCPFCGEELI